MTAQFAIDRHNEMLVTEQTETAADRRWSNYVDRTAKLMKLKSMDGNEATDGYSLDSLFDAYEARKTAAEYAKGWRPAWAR